MTSEVDNSLPSVIDRGGTVSGIPEGVDTVLVEGFSVLRSEYGRKGDEEVQKRIEDFLAGTGTRVLENVTIADPEVRMFTVDLSAERTPEETAKLIALLTERTQAGCRILFGNQCPDSD